MMMDKLHQMSQGRILKGSVIFIAVALLLTAFYELIDYFVSPHKRAVAVVNGVEISRDLFLKYYQSERDRLAAYSNEDATTVPQNDSATLNPLKQRLLSDLIDQQLLEQYTTQLNIVMSDEDVKTVIRNFPHFQQKGNFDNDRYLKFLQKIRHTPEQFSQFIRIQMVKQQLIEGLLHSEFSIPVERQLLFSVVMQQRTVRMATFPIDPLIEKQTVSGQEEKAHYDVHRNQFVVPEEVKVRYLSFSAEDLQPHIQVTEAEIQTYYQHHPQHYTVAPRRHISLIRAKNKAAAQELLTRLHQPQSDFAQIAKEESTDRFSAAQGGDLGWIEEGTTIPEIDKAAFSLQEKGALSEVITLEGEGYYILRLNDLQPERLKPLEEVRQTVLRSLQQQKAVAQYQERQHAVNRVVQSDRDNWKAIEAVSAAKAQESIYFNRHQIPEALNFPAVANALFNPNVIKSGQPTDLLEVSDERAFIVQVTHHKPETCRPFAAVKQEIIQQLKREKARQESRRQAEHLLADFRSGKGEQPFAALKLQWGKPQVLQRDAALDVQVLMTIFSHPRSNSNRPTYGIAENKKGEIILFELSKVASVDIPPAMLQTLTAQHLKVEQDTTIHTLLDALRRQAKIKQMRLDDLKA